MKLHQIRNLRNIEATIGCAFTETFFSPGFFRVKVDCPPFERKEVFGLPKNIYPVLRIEIQDSLNPNAWIQLEHITINSPDPLSFNVLGNVRLNIGWSPSLNLGKWSIEEKWQYRLIEVVIPVLEGHAETAATRNFDI